MNTRPVARRAESWSSQPLTILQTPRSRFMLWLLGAPALLPLAFMARSVVLLNGSTTHGAGNDVLGTGGELLLFATLAVTPLRTLTRRQWFVPLRRWYGIMFALTVFLDAIIASNDTAFNGGPVAELGAHSFLLVGTAMTLLLVPLLIMGIFNKWTFRQLGAYWKPIQKFGTYAVWGLLGLHLLLLDGFGPSHRDAIGPDKFPFDVLHQRFYEFLSCSFLLLVLRLPPVRSRIRAWQSQDQSWKAWLVLVPFIILALVAFGYLLNEEFYKGIAAVRLNPIND